MRSIAAQVMLSVEQGQSLSQCLPPALNRLPESDRPALQALCFGTCRWFFQLDGELQGRLKKALKPADRVVHHLMLVALFQLRHSQQATYAVLNETVEACRAMDKPHLTGLVNAVLRAAEREGEPAFADDYIRFSHPNWMVEKLRHNWPDDWQAIVETNNTQAPMTLRVNALRFSRDAYLDLLSEAGIQAKATLFAPHGIQLAAPVPVDRLPYFADGAVSVQDEAAQLCTTLMDLAPGQRVLDACAAPGGKTCAILEACEGLGEVVAIDESAERLPRIEENLARLDLNATVQQADAANIDQWWDGQVFDRILLDVPCSATGVIRRHPDIKLLRRESDIVPLAGIQLGLLSALWQTLKPGGRLVYATCSVFPQENHRIIRRFLKGTEGAVLLEPDLLWGRDTDAGRQMLPVPQGHDGFFYAVLEKPDL
jgi:16S rRNA (cytosine967-C5)-methyltransferase